MTTLLTAIAWTLVGIAGVLLGALIVVVCTISRLYLLDEDDAPRKSQMGSPSDDTPTTLP